MEAAAAKVADKAATKAAREATAAAKRAAKVAERAARDAERAIEQGGGNVGDGGVEVAAGGGGGGDGGDGGDEQHVMAEQARDRKNVFSRYYHQAVKKALKEGNSNEDFICLFLFTYIGRFTLNVHQLCECTLTFRCALFNLVKFQCEDAKKQGSLAGHKAVKE